MIVLKGLYVICITALILGGNKVSGATVCNDTDKSCLEKAANAHPIKSIETWRAELEKPISQRVEGANESLIEFIRLANLVDGFSERPTIPKLDAGFLKDFKAALKELPPDVLKVVGNRLVGIRFVSNLGGSGYTEYVYESNGQVVGAFVVLDSTVFQSMTANKWATWKERTPFKQEHGYSLDTQIETSALDTRKNAFQYILLHELGHVVSVGRNIHPNWNKSVQEQAATTNKLPFFETTWQFSTGNSAVISKFDRNFPQRKDVVYYGAARIPGSSMGSIYASLEQTSFATLYAATGPGDDFAEAFANYVHVVKQKRPWSISLAKDGKVFKTIKSCWEEERCAQKRKILEELFDS